MARYIITVASLAALLTLGAVGAVHAVRPTSLADAIRRHGVVPERYALPTAGFLIVAEISVAALGLFGIAFTRLSGRALAQSSLGAATAIYALLTLYAFVLVRRGVLVPCGCDREGHSANGWTVARNSCLTIMSVVGFAWEQQVMAFDAQYEQVAVSVLSAVSICVLVWNLPAALADPERDQRHNYQPALAEPL